MWTGHLDTKPEDLLVVLWHSYSACAVTKQGKWGVLTGKVTQIRGTSLFFKLESCTGAKINEKLFYSWKFIQSWLTQRLQEDRAAGPVWLILEFLFFPPPPLHTSSISNMKTKPFPYFHRLIWNWMALLSESSEWWGQKAHLSKRCNEQSQSRAA